MHLCTRQGSECTTQIQLSKRNSGERIVLHDQICSFNGDRGVFLIDGNLQFMTLRGATTNVFEFDKHLSISKSSGMPFNSFLARTDLSALTRLEILLSST
jgi:hypothetical protein